MTGSDTTASAPTLGPAALAALDGLAESATGPVDRAMALPPDLYTLPDVLHHERQRIFTDAWICLGREADLPEPGDYLTDTLGDQPVIVIRDRDGTLRGHANVCRHRMMQLLEGSGNCKRIVCPYHAWTYDLSGRLVRTRHMERSTDFDRKAVQLAEVRIETWQGWIYATLDRQAPAVAEQLKGLEPTVRRFAMGDYVSVTRQSHVWDTNWKVLTENFMESYHLPVAHRRTVGAWFPPEHNHFPARTFANFTFQTFEKTPDATYGTAHPDNRRLRGRWRYTSVMPTVFPSHMFVLAPDHLWYLSVQPIDTGRCRVLFGVGIAPEVHAALEDPEAFNASLLAFFDEVNAEDRAVVEAVWRNASAPLSSRGRLSWMERELHDFSRYLHAKLAVSRGKASGR